MTANTTPAPMGHNNPPAHLAVFEEIDDLYGEAKNWADGEAISSEEMHDAVTKLYDGLHELWKRAEELRKEEKKPFDDGAKAVQAKYKPATDKAERGKAALGVLLAKWRAAVQAEKMAAAAAARAEADRIAEEAVKAMRASSGNLEEREKAEELLAEAKKVERFAKRTDRQATTGTGLRSYWVAELVDASAGLDWAYDRDPARFTALVQDMAQEAVRGGLRVVPGFRVTEERRAA